MSDLTADTDGSRVLVADDALYPPLDPPFVPWPKIARLRREIIVTEKIDGTNACVHVPEDPAAPLLAGSRSRWIAPGPTDNHGFAAWVAAHPELRALGPGTHFGEWWGRGVNKRYPTVEGKRFSLFNVKRWLSSWVRDQPPSCADAVPPPSCCHVVPVLGFGVLTDLAVVDRALADLRQHGSVADPQCLKPEGIVVFHTASKHCYKVTLEKDEQRKGEDSDG